MIKSLPLLCVLVAIASAAPTNGGCTAVPKAQCGTDWSNNCLKCGSGSGYECEQCCPGCQQVSKGSYKYCQCSGPKPPPPPSGQSYMCKQGQCINAPGYGTQTKAQCEASCKAPTPRAGNFTTYQVGGMDVLALTGEGKTEKVVIMLHGGGGSGTDWRMQYNAGWLGDTSGIKYVFPTSPSHLWYGSTKQSGCGFCDECAYTAGSIEQSATRVSTLIAHELPLVSNHSNVYLAGFSQGAQLTAYMQIAKLDFALGGTIVMDGYPLPPVCNAQTVKSRASYSGSDMRWFIYWGGTDPIFPPQESLAAYHGMFNALNLPNSSLVFEHTEPGMTHTLIQKEFEEVVKFIRG